jgi:2-hydroxychromene-2-carboxylate isomerase
MTTTIDLYWSFRSPYSYIVLPRILKLRSNFDVSINLKIVHPNAIRNPAYFKRMDPWARPYFLRDSARVAEFHGLPFRRPIPDPIEQDPVSLEVAPEQPLARRLGWLGIAATERGKGLEFAWEVSALLWDGGTEGWDQGSHLARAAKGAQLDFIELEQEVAQRSDELEARLVDNDKKPRKAGHWGVPTMVLDEEPFFGQDRFDVLVWRLREMGIKEHESSQKQ